MFKNSWYAQTPDESVQLIHGGVEYACYDYYIFWNHYKCTCIIMGLNCGLHTTYIIETKPW